MKIIRKTYYSGSLMHPVTITQKFWDELTERRKEYKENNEGFAKTGERQFFCVDTTYGDGDLGERPKIPDWVYNTTKFIFSIISFACLLFMIYVFKRGY